MRSAQQEKVTAASSNLRWGQFSTVGEVQEWVDSLTATDWWERAFHHVIRIEVDALKTSVTTVHGVANACAPHGGGVIGLAKSGLNQRTVLHEMAHVVSPKEVHHGPIWARNFMTITYHALGVEHYKELYDSFVEQGVDIG